MKMKKLVSSLISYTVPFKKQIFPDNFVGSTTLQIKILYHLITLQYFLFIHSLKG
jgi:hypothetical protein